MLNANSKLLTQFNFIKKWKYRINLWRRIRNRMGKNILRY